MAQPNIHNFYRVWFTCIDPLVLIPTVYSLIFTPEVILDALIPATLSVYDPAQSFLFHQLAALYAFLGIVLGGVLRASSDINVWRIVTAGVLLIDVALLASLYVSLDQQGRLELGKWRWQDWGNVVLTAGLVVIRGMFLAGVGVGAEGKGKKA
ncbi:hypothetical protein FZEAL_84 [Fusarium zealandicum]|uniref:DUF7704 domain-containing protein n=1 Tax=Fusarium zealandicum TaxID=1053134 RepID=A0A8H4XQQ5_9HYPO|nr:hypothetical protein FZEAL_84 [Fusarium zealandicum]